MITIDLAVKAGDWPDKASLEKLTRIAIEAAAEHLDEPLLNEAEVSLLFTDDAQVQALNREWRQKDKPTNVLSFAANEDGGPQTPLLGDIILAFETVQREAGEQSKSFDHHLAHLLVHGFLHLLGYDHMESDEAERMETLETHILAGIAIADPYSST